MSPEEKVAESTEEKVGEVKEVVPGATEGETEVESATPEEERETRETTGDEEETEEAKKPKKPGGFQRRIRKLNARAEAAQAEADYWRGQAQSRQQEEKQPTAVEAKSKPKPEDFAIKEEDGGGFDHAAYTEALTDWKLEQRLTERDTKARESQAQTEQQQQGREFLGREAAFAETLPESPPDGEGYDEVADAALGMLGQLNSPATKEMAAAIMASDQGPAVLYFLGQNPDELQRIAKQNPKSAVMSLGAIADKLAQNTQGNGQETETPAVSRAPKPTAPIKKTAGGRKLRPDDPASAGQMSTDEWLKARRAQVRSRARG
jgi:hypothetical protein